MDARSFATFAALAMFATGVAGCIEPSDLFAASSDSEASAFANFGIAQDAALAWDPDAKLVSVLAFEFTESDEPRIVIDPSVGNGLAPAWWYVFAAGHEKQAKVERSEGGAEKSGTKMTSKASAVRAYRVDAAGQLMEEKDAAAFAAGHDHDMAKPIVDWKIDSNVAMGAALADESFRLIIEGANATLVEGLANDDGMTLWWLAAMSEDGFVVASVDAQTGTLIAVTPLDMDMAIPDFDWGEQAPAHWSAPPVHLEGDGGLASGQHEEYSFTASAAMGGILHIEIGETLPGTRIGWAVLDAEGEDVAGDKVTSEFGPKESEFELMIEEPGEYTFVIYSWGFIPAPIGITNTPYSFMLHLEPGYEMDHEHDEEE